MKFQSSSLNIAMLSIHSSPIGALGTRDTGGMSVYVREVAKELGSRGLHVDIFTRDNSGHHDAVIDLYDNVRLIHLTGDTNGNITKSSLYDYLPHLFHELESFRNKESIEYDVIHSHYWLSGVLGAEAQSLWNAKHIFTYHTIGALKSRACPGENESELRLATEKKLARLCDHIIVPTRKEKEYLIQYYDVREYNIKVVPCGVDPDRFKPVDKTNARQRLSFSGEDFLVLYVGRYTPIKGLDRLIESFGYLKHHARMRLVMVGGDGEASPMFRQLQSKAKALDIEDRVVFAGRVDQDKLPLYYSAADVLAVPSYYESFCLVALEALACGLPVVTTSVGAMEDIVEDGVTGYVAADSDPRHFSRLIEAVLANGLPSKNIWASVTNFSWARSTSKILEAYQEA